MRKSPFIPQSKVQLTLRGGEHPAQQSLQALLPHLPSSPLLIKNYGTHQGKGRVRSIPCRTQGIPTSSPQSSTSEVNSTRILGATPDDCSPLPRAPNPISPVNKASLISSCHSFPPLSLTGSFQEPLSSHPITNFSPLSILRCYQI